MYPPFRRDAVDADEAIRLTDNDAALARLSAVQRQYLQDPFMHYFVPRSHIQPPRPPLINLGTYIRSNGIDDLVHQWLDLAGTLNRSCQIISLGAGSDTRFWRLAVRIFVRCRNLCPTALLS